MNNVVPCSVCNHEAVYFFNWWKPALFISFFATLSLIGLLIALYLNGKLPNRRCLSCGHKFYFAKSLFGKKP